MKRWGLDPKGYGTSSSYMAVYIIKDAIERAGSWTGAVLTAFLIGFAQIVTTAWLGSHFKMVVVALLAIIVTLISWPSGLFGRQKELEERG